MEMKLNRIARVAPPATHSAWIVESL